MAGIVKHWPEPIYGIVSIFFFLFMRVKPNTVIIVEPNGFHAEILPGFSKYYDLLDYKVILFCRYFNAKENVFCRCNDRPRCFVLSPFWMKIILQMKKIREFDFVFFSSNQMFDPYIRYWGEYIEYLSFRPKARYGCFFVEHDYDQSHYDHSHKKYSAHNREIFVLTAHRKDPGSPLMLNPHYFGEISITPMNTGKRIFITVGQLNNKNKDIAALFEAVQNVPASHDYAIWLIGSLSKDVPMSTTPASIQAFGRLPFSDVYTKMEKADFYLPLFNPHITEHRRYLHSVTSGSCQLIFGFAKVPIIHRDFAAVFGFTEENAILHGDHDFVDALSRAMLMTSTEYTRLQDGIRRLADSVFKESLQNLKTRIDSRCHAEDVSAIQEIK